MEKIEFSAVLFDFDGTLADSEVNYWRSDSRLLAEYGIDFDERLRRLMLGRGSEEFVRILKEEYGVAEDPESILARKNAYYLEIARKETRLFPEMEKLLKAFHGQGVPLAVASGSPLAVLEELTRMLGLDAYLDAVAASEEVPRGKPAPDVFLEASRRLGIPPETCLVFEDSPYGIEAALAAGMKSAAVPTITTPPLPEAFLAADLLYKGGMDEFRAEDALSRLRYVPIVSIAGRR